MGLKSKSGHLASANGHLVADCNCCLPPIPPCDCDTLTVTFSGTSIPAGCIADIRYGAQFFESVGSADVDGSYTLTKSSDCVWIADLPTSISFAFYDTGSCAAAPSYTTDMIHIQVWQIALGWQVFAYCYSVAAPSDWYYVCGFDNGTSIDVVTQTTATNIGCHDTGTDLAPITNPTTNVQYDHENYGIPVGGTVSLSFP